MAKFTYAITSATGHIGHIVTEELLKKGHKVRALGHDMRKLQELKAKGAEVISLDITNSAALAKAFKGCNAVFSLLPPGYDVTDLEVFRDKAGEAIAVAVAKAKISHVLNLSSIGAELKTGTGPIKGLHRQEQKLNCIEKLNVLHLRASLFMENLLGFLPSINSLGTIATSLNADLPIPMVATYDIGLKAAELLHTLKFTGQTVFDFVGPREVTMAEATKIIGKALGKSKVKYVELSHDEAEEEMIAGGMKHQLAKLIVDMYQAYNERMIKPTQRITPEHRGKTTLEEFCKVSLQPKALRRAA